MPKTSNTKRLQYLDWMRGLGAVIMLQGHVFDSFTRNDLREGGAFVYSQFAGGMPPAIFLFLTGVTLAFLMDSNERKGLPAGARISAALRRAGYLFAVAFAFRVQLWLFAWPVSPWTDLFKVDILNCMGFGIAVMSVMSVFRSAERVRLCAALGLAIAFASPLVSQMDWSAVHPMLRAYIVPDYRYFAFFPWAAYLAFGMSAGSVLKALPEDATERAMQWAALSGGALILGSQYVSNLPYSIYTKSEFWLNSPAQILTKQGVTMMIVAFAFLWTRYATMGGWSWVRQLGTASLLVYWVHIELVYGRWLWFWKNALGVPQTVVVAAGLIVLMLILAWVKANRNRLGAWIGEFGWGPSPRPDTSAGD